MHVYNIICFLTLLPLVYSTTVNECGIPVPLPRFVQINNCVIGPCVLKIGTAVTANVTFDVLEDISVLTPQVYVKLFGSGFTIFPLPDEAARGCENLIGNRCPIEERERVTYQLYMPLPSVIPAITLDLRLLLKNDSNKQNADVACFEITLDVQN